MLRRLITCFCLALLLTSCAAQRMHDDGVALIELGQYEEGVAKLEKASNMDPKDMSLRADLFRKREAVAQRLVSQAESARAAGQLEEAEKAYRRIEAIDPSNPRAKSGLDRLVAGKRHAAELKEAEGLLKKDDAAGAAAIVKKVLYEDPQDRRAHMLLRRVEEKQSREALAGPTLTAAIKTPITLEFRDASIRQIFDVVSKTAGINFIFDRDVRPDLKTTLFVRDKSVEDVIRYVLVTSQLLQKVLDENTLLIYPNNPAKQKDYQDLVFRTFYLSNVDAKSAGALIKSVVKPKELYTDDKLNLLVIRDTPEVVRMAERLIANQDLPDPEVVLEVEVLEIGTSALSEIGIKYPDQISYSVTGAAGTAGSLTLREFHHPTADLVSVAVSSPFLVATLRGSDSNANILANPRIRVKNREKAKIHVGDKVPVITTTTTATGLIAESVNYLDVGLKLEVEPSVHLDDEVDIKVGLEVSSIVNEIKSPLGSVNFRLGNRATSTVLRLKDGETQMLAGLISDEERKSVNKIPGLGDIPLLGRLFSNHSDTSAKTEIVLLITPRIVRTLARPGPTGEEFLSGTEGSMGALPIRFGGRMGQSSAPAGQAAKPAAAPATQPPVDLPSVLAAALTTPKTAKIGDEVEVRVDLTPQGPVRSGTIDIVFDQGHFQFVKATPGALAAQPGAELKHTADQAGGRLHLEFSSPSDLAQRGELARLTFKVTGEPAPSGVRIDGGLLKDAAGKAVLVAVPPAMEINLVR